MVQILILILFLTPLSDGLYEILNEEYDNKFEKYHQVQTTLINATDCWICSHSPISGRTMPYLARPLTMEEMMDPNEFPMVTIINKTVENKNDAIGDIWDRASVQIPIHWVEGNVTWKVVLNQEPNHKVFPPFFTFPGKQPISQETLYLGGGKEDTFFWENDTTTFYDQEPNNPESPNPNRVFRTGNITNVPPGNVFTCPRLDNFNLPGDPSGLYLETTFGRRSKSPKKWLTASFCRTKSSTITLFMAMKMLRGETTDLRLASGLYYLCGSNAYKWLPQGGQGSCTIARVYRGTWLLDELPMDKAPMHLIRNRRDYHPYGSARGLIHLPGDQKFGLALTIYGLQVKNSHRLEKLSELFDNVTDYTFKALNETDMVVRQLGEALNQHTVVLDYLTAAQGGMCQIIGPTCCHYVDTSGIVRAGKYIEQAIRAKEAFRKEFFEEDHKLKWEWPNWLGWMNPANWFQGLGGWFVGIGHTVATVILLGIALYTFIRLFICGIRKVTTSNSSTQKLLG